MSFLFHFRWFAKVKATAPSYKEANEDGVLAFKGMIDHLMKK